MASKSLRVALVPFATGIVLVAFLLSGCPSNTPSTPSPVNTPTATYTPIGTDDLHLAFAFPVTVSTLGVRVNDTTASTVVVNQLFGIAAQEFSIFIPKVITVGHAYTMDIWRDNNLNGTWDPPPTDPQYAGIPVTASATGYTPYRFVCCLPDSSVGGFDGSLHIPSGYGDYNMDIDAAYYADYPGSHNAVARVTDKTTGEIRGALKYGLAGAYSILFFNVVTPGHDYYGDFMVDLDASGTCSSGDDTFRFTDTNVSSFISHNFTPGLYLPEVCPVAFPPAP